MKHRVKKSDPLIAVIKPRIGQLYHTSWGFSHGVVGKCVSISEQEKIVVLMTPKTNKAFKYPVKWEQLRHTRKNQLINPH